MCEEKEVVYGADQIQILEKYIGERSSSFGI